MMVEKAAAIARIATLFSPLLMLAATRLSSLSLAYEVHQVHDGHSP